MDAVMQLARAPRRLGRGDLALVAVLFVWAELEALFVNPGGPVWARALVGAGYALPLLGRRRFPFHALLVVGAVAAVHAWTVHVADKGSMPFPALLILVFSVGLYVEELWLSVLGALVPPALVIALSRSPEWRGERQVADYAILSFFVCGAWLAGYLIRRRALLAQEEGGEQARRAVRDERARIARELHDVVAHSVSIIALQAGAAEALVESEPQTARQHMATVRTTAHDALVEMRRLLEVLREDEATYAPQPQLSTVRELVAAAREAGQDVELQEEGNVDDVPAGPALAAYRIVQEALTNARKHAGAAATRVTIRHDGARLDLEVVNAGGSPVEVAGAGQGLIGMHERARVYGGTLTAAPQPDGGFAVRATLPLEAGAP